MSKEYEINESKYRCPECGNDKLRARSVQVCEDGCEMWVECAVCGYDPAESGDHVETVMGWDAGLEVYALDVWREKLDEQNKDSEVSP